MEQLLPVLTEGCSDSATVLTATETWKSALQSAFRTLPPRQVLLSLALFRTVVCSATATGWCATAGIFHAAVCSTTVTVCSDTAATFHMLPALPLLSYTTVLVPFIAAVLHHC